MAKHETDGYKVIDDNHEMIDGFTKPMGVLTQKMTFTYSTGRKQDFIVTVDSCGVRYRRVHGKKLYWITYTTLRRLSGKDNW